MDPKLPVEKVPGIGAYYSRKLKRLEIKTVEDLICHFPFRYDDFSALLPISNLSDGQIVTLQGNIWSIRNLRSRTGKFLTLATLADQTGTIDLVWFNQAYVTKTLKPGTFVSVSGKVKIEYHKPKILAPTYEILQERAQASETIHTGRLVPIYAETEGLSSKWLRAKIAKLLPLFLKSQPDFLPQAIIKRQKIESQHQALKEIHFPQNYRQVLRARIRLAFDELFLTQLVALLRKKDWQENKIAPKMVVDSLKVSAFINKLPFRLTSAQKKATDQILTDLKKETPANRLLEGDVGSGKTVVAAIAAYIVHMNDFNVLLAAPTEILAFQHQQTLSQILAPFAIKVGIWTGSKKQKGPITCGTHALLSTFKTQRQVGLVVVDEQHRFGVAQRAQLFLDAAKKLTPHLLTMTATPIPRTLALTLYGDLDLSVLDEMPKGRQPVKTYVVPNIKRKDAYKFIEKQIGEGRQAFIITPFVEPSETMATVRAATEEFAKLKTMFSSKVKLGLLHGRLKSKEKEGIINQFRDGAIDILVATPVVEVGIDVANAAVMMIESAERFGLAQLHQLRGRVGRGKHQSYCLLFSDSRSENSLKRLKSMEKIYVGAELAEIDLKMRGPGEIFGLRQSGFINFKIADLSDHQTISLAQSEANRLINENPGLKSYPLLAEKIKTMQLDLAQPN